MRIRAPLAIALLLGVLAVVFPTLSVSLVTGQPFPRRDALIGILMGISVLFGDFSKISPKDIWAIQLMRWQQPIFGELGSNFFLRRTMPSSVFNAPAEEFRVDERTSVYVSQGCRGKPLVFYVHGGGTVIGDARDTLFYYFSQQFCVYSVEYPLAPEFPYPHAVNHTYSALVYASDHAFKVSGADSSNGITLVGISGGGLIAGAVMHKALEARHPRIKRQILLVPMLSPSLATWSYLSNFRLHILDGLSLTFFWSMYLVNIPPHRCAKDRFCSPLAAEKEDVRNMPPTTIFVGSHDALRAEGEAYAQELQQAGVKAEVILLPGSHLCLLFPEHMAIVTGKIVSDA